jgi:predicted alpha-1,6-mannanase (GH76 family)
MANKLKIDHMVDNLVVYNFTVTFKNGGVIIFPAKGNDAYEGKTHDEKMEIANRIFKYLIDEGYVSFENKCT